MKVLIAVDGSAASTKAVQFAAELFSQHSAENLSITLFHVVESVPEFILSQATNDPFRQVSEEWITHGREAGGLLLAEYRATLEGGGVAADCLAEKLVVKESLPEAVRVVAALTIIDEMKSGDYDAVIIGRRGTSATIKSFIGGVAEKVAREAHGRTVMIVD